MDYGGLGGVMLFRPFVPGQAPVSMEPSQVDVCQWLSQSVSQSVSQYVVLWNYSEDTVSTVG